jgi:hypothetical protein
MPMEAHENPAVRAELGQGGTLAAGSSNSNSHNGVLGSQQDVRELVQQLSDVLPRIQKLEEQIKIIKK